MTVQGYFSTTNTSYRLNAITFADGTSWNYSTVYSYINKTITNTATVTGTSGNDVLAGGDLTTLMRGNDGSDTIFAGPNGTVIHGGTGTNMMYGGAGNDTIWMEGTADHAYAGAGDDIIIECSNYMANSIINGGSGTNTLRTVGCYVDISGAALINIQTLDLFNSTITMSAAQLAQVTSVITGGTIIAARAGTYDLSTKVVGSGTFNLTGSSGDDVLIANTAPSATYTCLRSGAGTNIIYGSAGADWIYSEGINDQVYAGAGNDNILLSGISAKIYAGDGDDTIYIGSYNVSSGAIIDGGAGNNTLNMYDANYDISGATISNIQTLNLANTGSVLSASQFAAFTTIIAGGTQNTTLWLTTAGTYDLGNKTTVGSVGLQAAFFGNSTLIGNSKAQWMVGGGGNDIIDGKGGADSLQGRAGNDTYIYNIGYGANTIQEFAGTDTLSFGTGISDESLWFSKNGNDLVINVLGTTDSVTISSWYSGSAYDVEKFTTSDGYKLDSKLAQLVTAMASYASSNSGFNATSATAMPTDTTLQSSIAACWHT